jgi:hypothetical protein
VNRTLRRPASGTLGAVASSLMRKRSLAVAVVVWISMSPVSQAKGPVLAPSGNSAVNQYLETIPTDRGGRPSNSLKARTIRSVGINRANGSPAIGRTTQNVLASHGVDGRAVVALAVASVPGPPSPRRDLGDASGQSDFAVGSPPGGDSPFDAVIATVTGQDTHGGIGIAMIVIPALIALIFGVVTLTSRHANDK